MLVVLTKLAVSSELLLLLLRDGLEDGDGGE